MSRTTKLFVILAILAAAASGFRAGLYAAGPLRVEQTVHVKPVLADGGALDDSSSCDLPWAFCWQRT